MIQKSKKYFSNVANIFYILLLVILIFGGRWYSMLYPFALNPDEALMGANALRAKIHGYNWDAVDGTTSGPLNSLILMWPNIIGFDTTLSLIRLTAAILLFVICIFVYKTIKINSHRYYASIFTLPLILFYSFAAHPDFLHYSSEIFPVFLLIIANYFILTINNYNTNDLKTRVIYFCIGLLLGAAPFAKLQSSIIAIYMGIYVLYLSLNKSNLKNTISLILGGIAPAIVILLPLFIAGDINHFWVSYIGMANDYLKKPITILTFHGLIASDLVLINAIYFLISCFFVAIINLLISTNNNKLTNDINKKNNKKIETIYLALLMLIVVWTVMKPGNAFPHYVMFFPPFFVIFISNIIFTTSKNLSYKNKIFINIIYLILFITYSNLVISSIDDISKFYKKYKTPVKQQFQRKNPELLSWLPIQKGHLVVWGFMPQWYIGSNMTPATRETFSHYQAVDNSLMDYYRPRFMNDIIASNLDVVVDSAHGASFRFNNPKHHSVRVFPEFSELLNKEFSRLSPYIENIDCSEIYIKNKYKVILDQRMVIPKTIEASNSYSNLHSANNLLDLNTTEDSCLDYWVLPDATLGNVTITLNKTENISSLMILNTKNSLSVDRASKDITVKFLNNEEIVAIKNIKMNDHPYWNNLVFNSPIASDKVIIEIKSFSGFGGGLNEIKIFRSIN